MLKSILLFALAAHGISASGVARAPKGSPRRSNTAEVKAAQLMFEQVKMQVGAKYTPAVGEMIDTMVGYIDEILGDMKTDKDDTQNELNKIGGDVRILDQEARESFKSAKEADIRLVECREQERRVKVQEEQTCDDAKKCWEGDGTPGSGCNAKLQECKDAQIWKYTLSPIHNCHANDKGIDVSVECPKKCDLAQIHWANHDSMDQTEINPAHECPDFKSFDNEVNTLVSTFESKYDVWKQLHEECEECREECEEKDDNCTKAEEEWETQRDLCEDMWHVFRNEACQYGADLHDMCSRKGEFTDFTLLVFSEFDTHINMPDGQTASQAYPTITTRDVGLSEVDRQDEYVALMHMKCILKSYQKNTGKLLDADYAACDKSAETYEEALGKLTPPTLELHNDCDTSFNRITFSGHAWTIGSSSAHYNKIPIEFNACIDTSKCSIGEVFDFCAPKEFFVKPEDHGVDSTTWLPAVIEIRSDTRVTCNDAPPVAGSSKSDIKFEVTNSDESRTDSQETTFVKTQDSFIKADFTDVFADDKALYERMGLGEKGPPAYRFLCDVDTKFYQSGTGGGADTSR